MVEKTRAGGRERCVAQEGLQSRAGVTTAANKARGNTYWLKLGWTISIWLFLRNWCRLGPIMFIDMPKMFFHVAPKALTSVTLLLQCEGFQITNAMEPWVFYFQFQTHMHLLLCKTRMSFLICIFVNIDLLAMFPNVSHLLLVFHTSCLYFTTFI